MALVKQVPGDLDIEIAFGDMLEPIELEFDFDISAYSFSASIIVPSTGSVIPMVVDESLKASRKISVSCVQLPPIGVQSWALKWTLGAATARSAIAGTYTVVKV